MRRTPGLPLVIGGLIEWALGIYSVWVGEIEVAALTFSLALLLVIGGIAIDSKHIRRNLSKEKPKPKVSNPSVEGFTVGVEAARKILEKERQKAELEVKRSQGRRDFIRLPNGKEVAIHLFYVEEFNVWGGLRARGVGHRR